MKGTRDQRWAAVYGAAYVAAVRKGTPGNLSEIAAVIADGAIAAEPEEAEPFFGALRIRKAVELDDESLCVADTDDGESIYVTRPEAAALARLLERFAETGEP